VIQKPLAWTPSIVARTSVQWCVDAWPATSGASSHDTGYCSVPSPTVTSGCVWIPRFEKSSAEQSWISTTYGPKASKNPGWFG
jgi:hypothetical protein